MLVWHSLGLLEIFSKVQAIVLAVVLTHHHNLDKYVQVSRHNPSKRYIQNYKSWPLVCWIVRVLHNIHTTISYQAFYASNTPILTCTQLRLLAPIAPLLWPFCLNNKRNPYQNQCCTKYHRRCNSLTQKNCSPNHSKNRHQICYCHCSCWSNFSNQLIK